MPRAATPSQDGTAQTQALSHGDKVRAGMARKREQEAALKGLQVAGGAIPAGPTLKDTLTLLQAQLGGLVELGDAVTRLVRARRRQVRGEYQSLTDYQEAQAAEKEFNRLAERFVPKD